ncbi:hypothetical protein G6030_01635 [Dietzia sp. E1]|uniref:hypothetical protein n=1 Tax=Dietzia sp. E1 TaxID=328361 RepID=UPI0015FA0A97|nr:hypothetical protein [Dietzia sp. E1]MBB1020014.1 hypothetical protein [Dietzia sp. E1]
MTTNPRRRLRIREDLPAPYVARIPEGEHYQPPPTDPAEDPRQRRVEWPGMPSGILSFGQALLVFANTIQEGMEAWRWNFPRSAEVFDGVHATEAGVDVQWITDETEETDDGR